MSIFHVNEYIFINFTIRENHYFRKQYRNQGSLYNKANCDLQKLLQRCTCRFVYILLGLLIIREIKKFRAILTSDK